MRPPEVSRLSLNTGTLGHNIAGAGAGWTPEQTIDACLEQGIGGIVFWRQEIGTRAPAIGAYARSAGIRVDGLCRTPFLVGPLAPQGHAAIMDDVKASITMAAELSAKVLTIVVGGVEPGTKGVAESLKLVSARVAEALPLAKAAGVMLALEPLHPVYGGDRSCLCTLRDALDICDAIGSPDIGVAIDIYHVWWDTNLVHQISRAGPRLFGFHLCDWLADTRDVLLDRGMMGDGVADIRAIRLAMDEAGYAGPCEVEVFSQNTWWKRDPGEVLAVMRERFLTVC